MPVTGMRWSDPPRASCVTGIGKSTFRPFVGLSVLWPGRHLAWVCGPFLARTALCGSRWNPPATAPSPGSAVPCTAGRGPREVADFMGCTLWWWLAGVEESKGIWWMPWRQEAMKDVARCEKPWGAASRL